MSVDVVPDDAPASEPSERCCLCRVPTRFWTALIGREPSDQVALCKDCAKKATAEQIPTKRAWCDKEKALERSTPTERRYRLYVEMQRHRQGTGVYRLVSDDISSLTHKEACTVRSKHSNPASILLVEADSAAERALTIYEGWHDSVDAALSRRRDEV